MRRPYYLIKRGEIWYYRLTRTSGLVPSDKTWHSTSCKSRRKAEEYMADLLASGSEATTPALPPLRQALLCVVLPAK